MGREFLVHRTSQTVKVDDYLRHQQRSKSLRKRKISSPRAPTHDKTARRGTSCRILNWIEAFRQHVGFAFLSDKVTQRWQAAATWRCWPRGKALVLVMVSNCCSCPKGNYSVYEHMHLTSTLNARSPDVLAVPTLCEWVLWGNAAWTCCFTVYDSLLRFCAKIVLSFATTAEIFRARFKLRKGHVMRGKCVA